MDLGLGGRGYLVTGASRGLGFAAAQALVADGARVLVNARADDGSEKTFEVTVRLDTPNEVTYFINSGILQTVLRNLKG